MRIRTVKPEYWSHEEMSEVSPEAALLALGLLNYADDQGWFKLHTKLIETSIFPLRELSVSIQTLLDELSNIDYFEAHLGSDGKKYALITNFNKHQRVNRPTPSKIAEIVIESTENEDSLRTHTQLTEPSPQEGKGKERKGTGKGKERSSPPSQNSDLNLSRAQKIVNKLFPESSAAWSHLEEHALYSCQNVLEEFTDSDWQHLDIYLNKSTQQIRGGLKIYPRSRKEFLDNAPETLEKVRKWWKSAGESWWNRKQKQQQKITKKVTDISANLEEWADELELYIKENKLTLSPKEILEDEDLQGPFFLWAFKQNR